MHGIWEILDCEISYMVGQAVLYGCNSNVKSGQEQGWARPSNGETFAWLPRSTVRACWEDALDNISEVLQANLEEAKREQYRSSK